MLSSMAEIGQKATLNVADNSETMLRANIFND
jgi:hypothetical protein